MYTCTEKGNIKCPMASKNGKCMYEGKCRPVVDQCKGCTRITEDGFCFAYIFPEIIWKHNKKCPLATHLVERIEEKKKKINPIKKSKRK